MLTHSGELPLFGVIRCTQLQ